MTQATEVNITAATEGDVPLMLELIRGLAIYEKLEDQMIATEAVLRESLPLLAGAPPVAAGTVFRFEHA